MTAVTGLATTGANVFTNVVYDIERITLPALIVRVGSETSTPDAFGRGAINAIYERNCDFDVIACAESNSDCDSALIGIAKEIEIALASASGPWSDLILTDSVPKLDGSAQKVRGSLTLRYRATYRTRRGTPDSAP